MKFVKLWKIFSDGLLTFTSKMYIMTFKFVSKTQVDLCTTEPQIMGVIKRESKLQWQAHHIFCALLCMTCTDGC